MRTKLRRSGRGLALVFGAIIAPLSAALAQTSTVEPAPVGVAVASSPSTVSVLPHDLSPWSMFLNADSVVKAILIGLAFASVVTWTVWLAKSLELMSGRRRLADGVRELKSAPTMAAALERVHGTGTAAAAFAQAAGLELEQSGAGLAKAGVVERVQLSLQRIEAALGRRMQRGTGVLATIGSTAPFVGLFGTVWGIMNSFVGISRMQTTNLAVVAPGIAEALLATAIGLVAAIPAVVIYNVFARGIAGYRALMADASAEVLRLVSRDLDRREAEQRGAYERRSSLRIAE